VLSELDCQSLSILKQARFIMLALIGYGMPSLAML